MSSTTQPSDSTIERLLVRPARIRKMSFNVSARESSAFGDGHAQRGRASAAAALQPSAPASSNQRLRIGCASNRMSIPNWIAATWSQN